MGISVAAGVAHASGRAYKVHAHQHGISNTVVRGEAVVLHTAKQLALAAGHTSPVITSDATTLYTQQHVLHHPRKGP
jgi:hypothetical protein